MTLISINNLYKSYGNIDILCGANLNINSGDKLGLLGINGSGKTTLLKIITGQETSDNGNISLVKELKYGYLSQKPGIMPQTTLEEFLKEALHDIYIMKNRLVLMEKEMSQPDIIKDKEKFNILMEKYGELSNYFESLDGYNIENRLKGVARGLGFSDTEMQQPVSQLSGGEKTRAQLASLLLREYDLLLLDEPTNNLDNTAMEWLENYLNSWKGSLVVVSHDRFFLDRVVNKIALLENCILKTYSGNYSSFHAQRELIKVAEEKSKKKQQQTLQKDIDFIRNASSEEIKRAQSRMKNVEKMKPLQENMPAKKIKPKFKFAGRGSNIVLRFEEVSKSFSNKFILEEISFKIKWGDHVAVVGPNGAGKSTILRLTNGEINPDKGSIIKGPSIITAYYDQEQQNLNNDITVLQNILEASKLTEPEARNYLASYLFRGDDVFKMTKSLSGGEKSRLSLAKTTLSQSNFLILDEPTNYLDIEGMEQLEKSLAEYPGTIIFVSHDRFFISALANVILEINQNTVKLYRAPYKEYLTIKENEIKDNPVLDSSSKKEEKIMRIKQREIDKQLQKELRSVKKEINQLKNDLISLEEKIHEKEKENTLLENKLADPQIYENFEEARITTEEFNKNAETLKTFYTRWEEIASKLDKLS